MKRGRVKRLGIAVFGNALLAACAPAIGYCAPGSVRSYDILVTRKDSLSREIGKGLKRRGYSVRSAVNGGGAPAVYLLWFTRSEERRVGKEYRCLWSRYAGARWTRA